MGQAEIQNPMLLFVTDDRDERGHSETIYPDSHGSRTTEQATANTLSSIIERSAEDRADTDFDPDAWARQLNDLSEM